MKLFFDIGNTRTKWALMSGDSLVDSRGVLEESGEFSGHSCVGDFKGNVTEAWVSCVGKKDNLKRLALMVKAQMGIELSLATVESHLGVLCNAYQDLDSLGVDRWVAALGARELVPEGDLIVVDAGTAVTIDYISNKNAFEGGVILPGLKMMHDSLVGKTAGITSELNQTNILIGKTTQQCVNAGISYGLVGAIEKVVEEIQVTCASDDFNVLICGGDAARIQSLSKLPMKLNPDLIFHGLNFISNYKRT